MRLAATPLLVSCALGAVTAMLAAPAAAQQARQKAPRSYSVTLPLLFDGTYQGDIATVIAADGSMSVDAERVIALLGQRLSPAAAVAIRAGADAAGQVGFARLIENGINAAYDPATLELKLSIPVARQGSQIVSILPTGSPIAGPIVQPSRFSASAILSVDQDYVWSSSSTRRGFEPATVSADLAATVGGTSGVSLFGELEFQGARDKPFRRGNVQLIHDDESRAMRYSAGDIAPGATGFQTAPALGGLSIERQYGAIQPLRSIRPSGRYSFVLDRPSTVDVVVNGTTLRTLQLNPGQYNLRDFPFFNGLNQVELYVVDGAGRRLIANFSQYYSARLVDRGIFEFGATGGVLQFPGDPARRRYQWQSPLFSGYVRYGLTSGLTLGMNAQVARNQWNAGLEGAFATPVGTFGVLAGVSDFRGVGRGTSFLGSYEGAFRGGKLVRQIRVNVEAGATSRNFTPITISVPLNRIRFSLAGRVSATLPGRIGLGIAATSEFGRDGEPDRHRLAFSVSRNFRRINLNAAFEREARTGMATDNRFLLSVSVPLGGNRTARAAYDSRNDQASLEFSQYRRDEIGTFGVRASLTRDRGAVNGAGEVDYVANRFAARLTHRAIGTASGRITSQESGYTLSTQIALAGGRLAVGRPVGPRFAIVSGHPTLAGAPVDIWQGPVRDRPQARAGALGPGLVSAGSSYLPTQLRVDVKQAPAGYDIGAGSYAVRPGSASGYAVTIGSDASRVVMGVLVDVQGRPLPLLGGSLVPVGRPTAPPILFFTNGHGRFVANGLAPGDYRLELGADGKGHAVISVPKKPDPGSTMGKVRVDGMMAPEPAPDKQPAVPTAARTGRSPAAEPVSAPRIGLEDAARRAAATLGCGEADALIRDWRLLGSPRLRERLAETGLRVDHATLDRLFVAISARGTEGAAA